MADKGYHKTETIAELSEERGVRTYIPEREQRGRRRWTDKPASQQNAFYANRRRVRGDREQTPAAATKRSGGADVCPHLRDGRRTADLAPRTRRRAQALADPGRGAELGPDPPHAVRHGHGQEPAGGWASFCVFSILPWESYRALPNARGTQFARNSIPPTTTQAHAISDLAQPKLPLSQRAASRQEAVVQLFLSFVSSSNRLYST